MVSVLSLPDQGSAVEKAVNELWDFLEIVDDAAVLAIIKRRPKVADRLQEFSDADVLAAIDRRKQGVSSHRTLKQVELEAILGAPEGFGEDGPLDSAFHVRRLPDKAWRTGLANTKGVAAVI